MQSDKNYATMVRLLWFVGFCGEVPTGVAPRIGGSPEWNRHVLYRAVKLGYLTVFRKDHNHRIVRTLRLTDDGLDYIGAYDAKALSYILAKSHGGTVHTNQIDKTLRNSAVATAIVMAYSSVLDFTSAIALYKNISIRPIKSSPGAQTYSALKRSARYSPCNSVSCFSMQA